DFHQKGCVSQNKNNLSLLKKMPINVETDVITCMRDIGNDHFFFPTVSQTKNERSACRAKIQIVRIFQGN
ncbi:MAG TPA: hypothetical protein PK022_08710, partial [Syntrophales bacterium]|nr:hypothetical protein [Syntrophales bacterium]